MQSITSNHVIIVFTGQRIQTELKKGAVLKALFNLFLRSPLNSLAPPQTADGQSLWRRTSSSCSRGKGKSFALCGLSSPLHRLRLASAKQGRGVRGVGAGKKTLETALLYSDIAFLRPSRSFCICSSSFISIL